MAFFRRSASLAAVTAIALVQLTSATAIQAATLNGTYVGVHSSSYNQDFFLGIPYAQAPIGDLRFAVPKPLNTKFTTPRQASQYGAACVGYGADDNDYPTLSEDCLFINVVRPSGYDGQALPVGVWIHGGGYYQGGSNDPRYNLSFIVKQGVTIGKPFIGVSINYRLSAWGFLSSSEVQSSGQTNLGLRDQRLALNWIQENIAAFGGDCSKVTLWGESAGAGSVGAQIIAYNGRNDHLLRGAIMESGGAVQLLTLVPQQTAFNSIVAGVGCNSTADKLACLRTVPFATLNTFINSTGLGTAFGPVKDGDFIANYPSTQLKTGAFVKVPVIIGTNSDEGTAFSPMGVDNSTVFYNNLINNPGPVTPIPASFADKIITAYPDIPSQGIPGSPPLDPSFRPSSPFGAQFRRSAAYYGDAAFIASKRLACQSWTLYSTPAYCYRFNTLPSGPPPTIGVTHFQEVAFVFTNLEGKGYSPISPFADKPKSYTDLAGLMSSSWAAFIVDLDPNSWIGMNNSVGGVKWPAYSVAAQNIVWDANVTALAFLEPDSFRNQSIGLIIDNLQSAYGA